MLLHEILEMGKKQDPTPFTMGNALIFSMNSAKLMTVCSSVAQSVERAAVNRHVVGSSPTRGATIYNR